MVWKSHKLLFQFTIEKRKWITKLGKEQQNAGRVRGTTGRRFCN